MLVSALKMKRATEEIISFTVSKSFYHVCRIILEYHMNIIWENLSFTTYNQKRGVEVKGKKKAQVCMCFSMLNHISSSKICRDVLGMSIVNEMVTSNPSCPHEVCCFECWLYPGANLVADAESQKMGPSQTEPRSRARAQVLTVQSTNLPGTNICALIPLSSWNTQ